MKNIQSFTSEVSRKREPLYLFIITDIISKEAYPFLCQIWDIEEPEFGYDQLSESRQ
jgi:hypothetical protein